MKVGILTFYHGSNNYGGNLQAYALTYYLNKYSNVETQQISYRQARKSKKTLKQQISKLYHAYIKDVKEVKGMKLRDKCVKKFNNYIPHSHEVYTKETIKNSLNEFDIYITGSDQVFNPAWTDEIYLLDFVSSDKYKFSYAASLGVNQIDDETKEMFINSLDSFDCVSFREKDAIDVLELENKASVVLDPTLLLSRSDWDEVCSSRLIKEKYIFTYFLGESVEQRKFVEKIAKDKNLIIVNIPHVCGYLLDVDKTFGDIRKFDISPNDFISLIKNAEYVFTDSFHACVFSIIYNKNFFAFKRTGLKDMSSRLYNLLDMFELSERFCDSKDKFDINYIYSLNSSLVKNDSKKYLDLLEHSKKFIENAITDGIKKVTGVYDCDGKK